VPASKILHGTFPTEIFQPLISRLNVGAHRQVLLLVQQDCYRHGLRNGNRVI
jgi:hypothetical protein